MRLPIGSIICVLLAMPIVLSGDRIHYLPNTAAQSGLLVGLILASPVLGILFLAFRFTKWHRGFHRRIREPRR